MLRVSLGNTINAKARFLKRGLSSSINTPKRVGIIGGGVAGLQAAKCLAGNGTKCFIVDKAQSNDSSYDLQPKKKKLNKSVLDSQQILDINTKQKVDKLNKKHQQGETRTRLYVKSDKIFGDLLDSAEFQQSLEKNRLEMEKQLDELINGTRQQEKRGKGRKPRTRLDIKPNKPLGDILTSSDEDFQPSLEKNHLEMKKEADETNRRRQQEKDLAAQLQSESVWQYFVEGNSLPELVYNENGSIIVYNQDGSIMRPLPQEKGTPYKPIHTVFPKKAFGLINHIDVDSDSSLAHHFKSLSVSVFTKKSYSYRTVRHVRQTCELVLLDIVNASHLWNTLVIVNESGIMDHGEADEFWVITTRDGHIPVGVVVVVKPDEFDEPLQSPNNHGRLFDCMVHVCSNYGVKSVFGILTNYKEWQICCFPDLVSYALSTTVKFTTPAISRASSNNATVDMNPRTLTERALSVSEVYSYREAKPLALALYSIFWKMSAIGTAEETRRIKAMINRGNIAALPRERLTNEGVFEPILPPLLSLTRAYIVMNRDKHDWVWEWGVSGMKTTSGMKTPTSGGMKTLAKGNKTDLLSLTPPPASETENFYILRDFGGGADGRVWLAANGDDSSGGLAGLAVIKVCGEATANHKAAVTKEVKHWHDCGILSVRETILCDKVAIVMPYAFHYNYKKEINMSCWKTGQQEESRVGGIIMGEPPIKGFSELRDKVLALDPDFVLEKCISRCANAKLVHTDIEWRHVAIFPASACRAAGKKGMVRGSTGNSPLKPDEAIEEDEEGDENGLIYSFIDLTHLKSVDSVEEAREDMVRRAAIRLFNKSP